MITSHLMCVVKQLFYDKNIMFERKNNSNEKPWQDVSGKKSPGKKPPDSKPNPIPNLNLTLHLIPHGGLFSGGIFS